jgi:hypothetical protein
MTDDHEVYDEIFRLRRSLLHMDARPFGDRALELKRFILEGDRRDREMIKAVRRRLYDEEITIEEYDGVLHAETRRHMDEEREAVIEAAEELADLMGATA